MEKGQLLVSGKKNLEIVRYKVSDGFYTDRGVFHGIVRCMDNTIGYMNELSDILENPALKFDPKRYQFLKKRLKARAEEKINSLLKNIGLKEIKEFSDINLKLAGINKYEYDRAKEALFEYRINNKWEKVPFNTDSRLKIYHDISDLVESKFELLRVKLYLE